MSTYQSFVPCGCRDNDDTLLCSFLRKKYHITVRSLVDGKQRLLCRRKMKMPEVTRKRWSPTAAFIKGPTCKQTRQAVTGHSPASGGGMPGGWVGPHLEGRQGAEGVGDDCQPVVGHVEGLQVLHLEGCGGEKMAPWNPKHTGSPSSFKKNRLHRTGGWGVGHPFHLAETTQINVLIISS